MVKQMSQTNDMKKIIIALDYDDEAKVLSLCNQLDPNLCRLKIGKQLFTKFGPSIIENLHQKKFEIFLDLKFHDIPITIYKACLEAYKLGIWMLNVHLLGGQKMLESAKQARDEVNKDAKLIGVSILTSHDQKSLNNIGIESREGIIKKLTTLATEANIDGIVCSPGDIKHTLDISTELLYVTPGIRLDDNKQDHSVTYTPSEAIKLGANYLVIGRPITESNSPMVVIESILSSL
jgi:orotidine-5'-phosphate decarboxylase